MATPSRPSAHQRDPPARRRPPPPPSGGRRPAPPPRRAPPQKPSLFSPGTTRRRAGTASDSRSPRRGAWRKTEIGGRLFEDLAVAGFLQGLNRGDPSGGGRGNHEDDEYEDEVPAGPGAGRGRAARRQLWRRPRRRRGERPAAVALGELRRGGAAGGRGRAAPDARAPRR